MEIFLLHFSLFLGMSQSKNRDPLPLNEDDDAPSCSSKMSAACSSPETMATATENEDSGFIRDKDLVNVTTAEEYLLNKGNLLLNYERQMFLDMAHEDALLVAAK